MVRKKTWQLSLYCRRKDTKTFSKRKGRDFGFSVGEFIGNRWLHIAIGFKDEPEEDLVEFVNERIEIDYNGEAIEDIESDDSVENMDVEIELYDTKYVKKIQRKLKRKGFQLVWFQLDNDQYYVCILPKAEILPQKWHEIKLRRSFSVFTSLGGFLFLYEIIRSGR